MNAISTSTGRVVAYILLHGTTDALAYGAGKLSVGRYGMYGYRLSYSALVPTAVHRCYVSG